MSHMPGPWAVIPTNAKSYVISGDGGTYDVAIVRDIGKHDNAANARLIAAAPELLEALKMAYRRLVSMQYPERHTPECQMELCIMRDVIAAATGKSAD